MRYYDVTNSVPLDINFKNNAKNRDLNNYRYIKNNFKLQHLKENKSCHDKNINNN